MTGKPVDLATEREQRRESYAGVTCACGCAWFDAVVTIEPTGEVTGYNWPPKCHDCGTELKGTR